MASPDMTCHGIYLNPNIWTQWCFSSICSFERAHGARRILVKLNVAKMQLCSSAVLPSYGWFPYQSWWIIVCTYICEYTISILPVGWLILSIFIDQSINCIGALGVHHDPYVCLTNRYKSRQTGSLSDCVDHFFTQFLDVHASLWIYPV